MARRDGPLFFVQEPLEQFFDVVGSDLSVTFKAKSSLVYGLFFMVTFSVKMRCDFDLSSRIEVSLAALGMVHCNFNIDSYETCFGPYGFFRKRPECHELRKRAF